MKTMSPLATWMCRLLAGLTLTLTIPLPAVAAEAPPPEPIEAPGELPAPAPEAAEEELEEVIIYATSGEVVAGVHAESELKEEGIAAYGANTVGELLNQVAPDVDNSEQGPVILINGKPANGIRSVNDLPPEAIAKLQVLPPQAAGAIGESPTRRVINVVLKNEFRQGTGNLTVRGATAGRGFGSNANLSMLRLVNNNTRNFSLYANRTAPLLEAHRGILSQSTVVPYDLTGNVLSWPLTGGEIDPDLSLAAGVPVTVAGVPAGVSSPTLGNFLPFANIPNVSDMGRYRTLVADQFSYGMNGNVSRQLPRNISLNLNANLDRNESRSLTGATSTLLHVPAASPFSPFSQDVAIARYLGEPLRQKRESTNANFLVNLSMQLGKWRLLSDSRFSWNESTTDSERRVDTAALQAAIDAGTANPFDAFPSDLLDSVLSDRARARGHTASVRMQLAGALFNMPAGKANFNLSAQWQETGQRSRTVGTNNVSSSSSRQDRIANFNLQLPLLGSPQSQGFGMGGELSGAARDVTASGTLYTYGSGLNWRNGTLFNMRVGYNREKVSPSPSALTDPIVTIDDYRAYDFIREETVLVRYITGGNPDLRVENRDIITISGQVRPFKTVDFNLNAQYTRTMYHDPMAALPPPSAEVQAAFPDRFRRDADGRLFEIDARMVNFVSTRNEQFRWGGNFRRAFGVPRSPGPAGPMSAGQAIPAGQVISAGGAGQTIIMTDGGDSLSGAGWRLNANFTHQWQVAYKRLMRPGLPVVDLLSGGAGFGTPQSRHRVQSTVGLAYNGTGMQLNSNWTSASHLNTGTATAPSRLDFSSTLRFDLQAFTNLGVLYATNKSLQGVRISLNVENLLDYKQSVKDQNGVTPLRYQPYLMNPLGRVISLSFRKAFS
jgi:iron complex outermembrane recepter protein